MPRTPLIYLGKVDEDPRFFSRIYGGEIEFVPDSNGFYSTLLYREGSLS